nr:ATP synthase F0 subunit 8 [Acinopterus sp.]
MPQMSPSWWTMIMIVSITMMMMLITKTYFDKSITPKISIKTKKSFINWKW